MANYLPVLLISVSTNTVPDDSSLSTLPRAQVDYLSHDWQEEDVWKSWRNMTRQKNAITNGMRLENASWRTWWKQRNKLKTVSPETLNWLKDSDVTWLYGPLHTAVDWTPPPKPPLVPDCIDGPNPTSAHDRLDFFSPNPTLSLRPRKPILKHRSISELLTSDLIATSPIFSPVESEDEDQDSISPTASSSFLSFAARSKSKRPTLIHTKSDTHITRWGASRAFRNDSPPGIDPPGFDTSKSQNQSQTISSQLGPICGSTSQDSNSSGGVGPTSSSGERTKKKHISFNTFVEQYIAIEKPKKSTSGFFGPTQGGNWVPGRRNYVDVVDDGYEEDEEDSEDDIKQAYRQDTPVVRSYTEFPDEDEDDGVIEMRSSSHRRNHTKTKPLVRSQSKVSTTSSSSSTSTASNTTNSSSTDSSHASTDTTSPAGSLSPSRINRKPSSSSSSTVTSRRFSSSTYRPSVNTYTARRGQPPLIRNLSEHVHVTIAPIAPTILKTTEVWSEGFGDEEASDDGFGSWNSKGIWSGQDTSAGIGKKGKGKTVGLYGSFGMSGGSDKEGQSSDGTPVELVYVPPFGSKYSLETGEDVYEGYDGYGGYLDEDEFKESEQHQDVKAPGGPAWNVDHQTGVTGSVGPGDRYPIKSSHPTTAPIPIGLPTVVVDDLATTSALSPSRQVKSGSLRTGNRQRPTVDEEDAYDIFGAPDLGEDYYVRRGGRGYERDGFASSPSSAAAALGSGFSTSGSERQRERERERRTVVRGGEERQSRSRSRSQSRTPSPAFISSPVPAAPAPTTSNDHVQSARKRSSSASATPSGPASFSTASSLTSDMLFPPSQRGRTPTQPHPQSQSQLFSQPQSRGRSSTRTVSSPSERESGSSVGSSPMGSLSPDGLVRAGGREKERERENERGRERRGRERTSGKTFITSEVDSAASSGVRAGSGSSSTGTARTAGGTSGRVATDSNFSSTSSYSSSTSTVMGPPLSHAIAANISPINKDREHKPKFLQQQEIEYMRRAEEEQRRVHPTPSNSPVVGMRMSVSPEVRNGVFDEHAAIDQRDRTQGSTPGDAIPIETTFPFSMAELVPSAPLPPPSPSSPMLPRASGVGHMRSSSFNDSVPLSTALSSPTKLRPPPLIPPPSLPAKPSTSFTAVSSSSPASPIISAASHKGLASPTSASSGEHTIVGKAVDIVSSAGAFLGLWQHSPMPEGY